MRGGVMVNSLDSSQLSFEITRELNKVKQLDEYWDIILFYNSYGKSITPPEFAMLQDAEVWGFDAPVIATDLSTAEKLIKCPRPTKKLFYVWELEWIFERYDIEAIAQIYMHPSIELVARSEEEAKIISKCWKEPIQIIEDFNYEKITKEFAR